MHTMGCRREVNYLILVMQVKIFSRVFGVFLAGVLLLNVVSINPAWGIGQLSSPVVQEDLLQGQEFKVEILPYNSEDTVQIFDLSTSGAVTGWAKFYATTDKELTTPITEVTVQPRSYASAMAVLKVPAGTPNGVYEGGLDVASKISGQSEGLEGSSTSVRDR